MAFPADPLPITVWHAPGADPVDPSTWDFSEITTDVRVDLGVRVQVGANDEGAQVDATQVRANLDNRTGNYSPRNPLGANFGQLSRGTPVEVRITRIDDSFTRSGALGTEPDSGLAWAVSGATWATTGSAATSSLGSANTFNQATIDAGGHDVDVTHVSSISAVTTGAAWVDATIVRRVDDDNFYRLHTEFTPSGTVFCKVARVVGGVSADLTDNTDTGVTYTAGTVIATRVRAVGARLQIRAWLASGSEPTTWTVEADDDEVHGTEVGLYEWRVAGNTNVGSLTCTIDDFRSDVFRAVVPVPEWPVRWPDKSGNDAIAPIAGAGPLRRLSQGRRRLRSPIYRQLIGQPAAGYWPFEEGEDVSSPSALSRGLNARCINVTFGSSDAPAGSSAAATLTSSASSSVACPMASWPVPQDGYAAMMFVRQPALSGSASSIAGNRLMLLDTVGTVVTWVVYSTSGGFNIEGYNSSGGLTVNVGTFAFTIDPTEWYAIQLETEEVGGGNVDWAVLWHAVGSTTFYVASGTYAGTADRITRQVAYAPADGTLICHLWSGDDALPFVDSTFQQVSDGYAGETAGARVSRLCTEEGIPVTVIGDVTETTAMSAQQDGDLLALLRECELADQGVLHERGAGLAYLTRQQRMNAPVVLALDFDSGHIAEPPEPTDDDQQLVNRVVLRNPAGIEVTAEDPDSIALDGEYLDELQVLVESGTELVDHAWWRLHLGRDGGLRWPRIELDLARNPGLIGDWVKVRVGDRITVASPPDQVAGGSLDLVVDGWTETLGTFSWRVELTCSPAQLWQVGALDDTGFRLDLAASTTAAEYAAAATTVVTSSTAEESWSVTGTPYDWLIAGERVTVTRMSQPGSIAVSDGSFEAGTTGWAAFDGTLTAQSSVVWHGTQSAQLEVVGSPSQSYVRNNTATPVTVGEQYTVTAWMRGTGSTAAALSIDWYDSGFGYLSTDAVAITVTAEFARYRFTATAPASAAFVGYGPTLTGSPSAGTLLYFDDIDIAQVGEIAQTAIVTRAVNGIAKTLPSGSEVHIADPVRMVP